MSIQIEHISKLYNRQYAVKDISFSIPQGQTCGFLGPNGAGKSTTLKIITGFLQPDEGTVTVNGIRVSDQPIQAKQSIGYLAEHNPLYKEMYVREFLHFIASLHHLKSRSEAIERTIEQTGLEKESHKQIGQLSKGYQQRVGLAQALIHNPPVLILDEPLSGLDPNQLEELRELIKQLGQTKTVIFSSHILQEVEQVANRIIMIKDGELVMDQIQQTESSAGNKTLVEFEEELSEELQQQLANIAVFEQQQSTYILKGDSADQRKQLFKFAQRHQLTLLRLEQRKEALTDIFKQKTSRLK